MRCDNCGGDNAIIHIRQIMGSDVKDVHICSECADKKGILNGGNAAEFSLPEILNGIIADITARSDAGPDACPSCGLKREDVDKEGRIGCSDCVSFFSEDLHRAIKNRNLTPLHPGKLPRRLKPVKTLLFDKEELKDKLKQAIEEEDYETAILLRDRIRALEADAGVVP